MLTITLTTLKRDTSKHKGEVFVGNKKIIKVFQTVNVKDIPVGKIHSEFTKAQLKSLIDKAVDIESKDGYSFVKTIQENIIPKNGYYMLRARLLFKQQ